MAFAGFVLDKRGIRMNQALKKQVKKYAVMTIIMLIMALAVRKLNQVSKTQLINRTGQTFETGKVVRILEDNIQEDGMRVGQQTVVVKRENGPGADNDQQRRVSVRSSLYRGHAGGGSSERCGRFGDHKRVFHGPERSRDRVCGALPAGIVPGRRHAGRERRSRPDLYLWSDYSDLSSGGVYGIFPILDSGIFMCHYNGGDHVSHRRCL